MPGTYKVRDFLHQRAKEEGYRSRASYKLLELDKRFRLFRSGMRVLDLGCAPGGWLQVAAKKVGPSGRVVGIDLEHVAPFSGAELSKSSAVISVICADILDEKSLALLQEQLQGLADIVLSDMSPHLSGIRDRDNAQLLELLESAHLLSEKLLQKGGCFIAKAFPSPGFDSFFLSLKGKYAKLSRKDLAASRKTSNELYLIAQGFQGSEKYVNET